jgi:L-lysine 6-transaminase
MVRSTKILQIIHEENLVENSRLMGEYLLHELFKIESDFPDLISNARGLGLLAAFDFPNSEIRNEFLKILYKEKLIMLGCGSKSVRFRTALNISKSDLDRGLEIIRNVLILLSN